VDVLIGGVLVEARRAGFGANVVEGFDDLGALFGGEDADLLEGASETFRELQAKAAAFVTAPARDDPDASSGGSAP
jgi:hypothetical protein